MNRRCQCLKGVKRVEHIMMTPVTIPEVKIANWVVSLAAAFATSWQWLKQQSCWEKKHTKYFRRMLQVIPGQYASFGHSQVCWQSKLTNAVRLGFKGGGQSRKVRGEGGGGGGRLNPVKVKLSKTLLFSEVKVSSQWKGESFLRQWKEESFWESIGNLLIVTRIEWAKGNWCACISFVCWCERVIL